MVRDTLRKVLFGVGTVGLVGGVLVGIQLPSSGQYHQTTLSAAGVGLLLVLFGIKTLAEAQW